MTSSNQEIKILIVNNFFKWRHMKKMKLAAIGLVMGLGALFLSLSPTKANAQGFDYYNQNMMNYGQYGNFNNYFRNMNNYYRNMNYNFGNNFYNRYRFNATYPRTVYLVDAGNSANQLNIINATTGGSTTAARIIVPTWAYNRVVNDYNQLGVVSVRVSGNNVVMFQTVNGSFAVGAISVSFQ
jgi:hypothetical protein